jgi:hypothetical protein
VFLDGQMGQEAVDIDFGKQPGMPVLVEQDAAPNPVEVGFFGAPAVVPCPQDLDNAVIETGTWLPSKEALRQANSLSRSTHDLPPRRKTRANEIRAVPKGPVKQRPRRSVALQGAALAGDMTSGGVYPRRAEGGDRVPLQTPPG